MYKEKFQDIAAALLLGIIGAVLALHYFDVLWP